MKKKFYTAFLLLSSVLFTPFAQANWDNIGTVQYLMQNLDERDEIVRMYADVDLAEVIDYGNQIEDGICLPWDMMGGMDFDALAVSTSAEYSIDSDGDVQVEFYANDFDTEKSIFFVRFNQYGQISNIYNESYDSFGSLFSNCINGL